MQQQHAERTKQEIIQLCHTALDARALRHELLKLLQTVIPFDFVYFCTTDPATQFLTSSIMLAEPPSWLMPIFLDNEFLQDDFNKFNTMLKHRRSVQLLSEATNHKLDRSQRYREMLVPMALGDELRAIFVSNGVCWGTLCLDRELNGSMFTSAEAAYLTELTPHIADGLRKALLVNAATTITTPESPGVLILAPDLSIVAMTPTAEYWLGELADTATADKHILPLAVRSVVSGLRAIEHRQAAANFTPKSRLRTRSGYWLVLSASRLISIRDAGQISVIFELARSTEISPLIMQAYNLTKREGEVTQCVLLGWSTAEISSRLFISANTVQDHLKAIFDKVDVSSRGELARRIFVQHYQPHMGA